MNTRFVFLPLWLSITSLIASLPAAAQFGVGGGAAQELYQNNCASCHGKEMQGGQGSSLIDDQWQFGASNQQIAAAIRDGIEDAGMPAFKQTLDEQQIRSLVILMREQKQMAASAAMQKKQRADGGVFTSTHHNFTLQRVGEGTGILWGLDFMPDGSVIATQQDGVLWLFKDGERSGPISGTPKVWHYGQGGLLDVKLHPDYDKNRWIYLSFSETSSPGRGMTAIVRGRIKDGRWVEQEDIFRTAKAFHGSGRVHFGSRLVFKDGYLFFSIGDRGDMHSAQDLASPNGKIHRIYDDGRIPKDNPFAGKTAGGKPAFASIWTYGNRNPQGLDSHPLTGELWETEHGPRGGDEVNRIEKGNNYGWPVITHGMNYNGTPITDKTEQAGMQQPKLYWVPSIAACGAEFYEGGRFPKWRNNLFVGGLSTQQLHRLQISADGEIVADEIILKGQGRVRDVGSGPDGNIYVLLNRRSPDRGGVYRLVPRQ